MTVTVGITALGLALILWFVFHFTRQATWHEWTVVLLTLTSGACLAGSAVGRAVRGAVANLDRVIGPLVGEWTGQTLIALAALLVFAILVAGLWQRGIELYTVLCAFTGPLLVGAIPGPTGALIRGVLSAVGNTVASIISALFGL